MANIDAINTKIETIANAERVTKQVLSELSRELLEFVVIDDKQDIQPVNRLMAVLTPVNRKVAVLYFKHFMAFMWDEENAKFVGKDKKKWDKKKELVVEFLDAPHNNIWTWADRNIEVEAKPYNASKVSKEIEKAIKNNISQKDIVRAVLAGGLEMDAFLEVMKEMVKQEEEKKDEEV